MLISQKQIRKITISRDWIKRISLHKATATDCQIEYMLIMECNQMVSNKLYISQDKFKDYLSYFEKFTIKQQEEFKNALTLSTRIEYIIKERQIQPIWSVEQTEEGFEILLDPLIIPHWTKLF